LHEFGGGIDLDGGTLPFSEGWGSRLVVGLIGTRIVHSSGFAAERLVQNARGGLLPAFVVRSGLIPLFQAPAFNPEDER